MKNEMELIFDAISANEGFARVAVAAFISHLNPTLEELDDIKTAVSEAVTNSIIHGYENYGGYCCRGFMQQKVQSGQYSGQPGMAGAQSGQYSGQPGMPGEHPGQCSTQTGLRQAPIREPEVHPGKVRIYGLLEDDVLHIEVTDAGKGIEDLEQAMEPLFTTKPELERSGMGFAFMEAFMDDLEVESKLGKGTTVRMTKKVGSSSWIDGED